MGLETNHKNWEKDQASLVTDYIRFHKLNQSDSELLKNNAHIVIDFQLNCN